MSHAIKVTILLIDTGKKKVACLICAIKLFIVTDLYLSFYGVSILKSILIFANCPNTVDLIIFINILRKH